MSGQRAGEGNRSNPTKGPDTASTGRERGDSHQHKVASVRTQHPGARTTHTAHTLPAFYPWAHGDISAPLSDNGTAVTLSYHSSFV